MTRLPLLALMLTLIPTPMGRSMPSLYLRQPTILGLSVPGPTGPMGPAGGQGVQGVPGDYGYIRYGEMVGTTPRQIPANTVVNSNPILSGLAASTILASSTLTTSLTGCTIAVRQVASGVTGAAVSTAPIQWHVIGL